MKDVKKLVPRTPPEGLLEWAERRCPELERDALLIETVWAQDWSLEAVMDEWARGRKIRVVRAKCSACTEDGLLSRSKDGYGNYGFIDTEYQQVITAGDVTNCPFCGGEVKVEKRANVKRNGYMVIAEASVMSAAVAGPEHCLVLTGWTIEKRVNEMAQTLLEAIPAEAYVFGPEDCAQLMGWENGYSGTAGYYIRYTRGWRQPKDWKERWGQTGEIYGLTPELIASSCLPHCKLDLYMERGASSAKRYPVPYLRLYQAHRNVESLLVHGLPDLVRELILEKVGENDWEKNKKGRLELEEIRWAETRPAQMLGLTKDELAMARARGWGALWWRLFTRAKAAGELLTDEDITQAFYLGDEDILEIAERGLVAKSVRYLLRQIERAGLEPEDEDPQPEDVIGVSVLLDYWRMAELGGSDLSDPSVRWPRDLLEAHDRMTQAAELQKERDVAGAFRVRRRQLSKWAYKRDGLLIRPAASQRELVQEGDALRHCVKTYAKRHAEGKTAIFFIRRAAAPKSSYYTLELDEVTLTVRQNRGERNCARTPEVEAFEQEWLAWLRAGAPRDKKGRPKQPPAKKDPAA